MLGLCWKLELEPLCDGCRVPQAKLYPESSCVVASVMNKLRFGLFLWSAYKLFG